MAGAFKNPASGPDTLRPGRSTHMLTPSPRLDKEQLGDKGLFEDIAEGLLNAKVVVAFISDEYAKVRTPRRAAPLTHCCSSSVHACPSPLSLRTASWNSRTREKRCACPSFPSLSAR